MNISRHVDGFSVEPLEDGSISFKFLNGDLEVGSGTLSPAQVTEIVGGLLGAAAGAFQLAGKSPEAARNVAPYPVNATNFGVGTTKVRGRLALVMHAGDASLAFAIDQSKFRILARALIEAFYRSGPKNSLRKLLAEALKDASADFQGLATMCFRRLGSLRRSFGSSFLQWISGRSLRVFREVLIVPEASLPKYASVGECIYCGTSIYSKKPDLRSRPLGAEHIIAEGLGGKLELPEASCQSCEDITGRLVEGDVLLRTLKSLRLHLQIRGKRKSSRPSTLPLTVQKNGVDEIVQMPVEDYPVIFNMPVYGPPGIFSGGQGGNQMTSGFSMVVLNYDQAALKRKYGIASFSSPVWDTHMLFRMLGKIGHSFAVAEVGLRNFKPLLQEMIVSGDVSVFNHIGGDPDTALPSTALHELRIGYQRANRKDYLVASIRLFARQSGPTYYVVVGEALEGGLKKLARVSVWNICRIANIFARPFRVLQLSKNR